MEADVFNEFEEICHKERKRIAEKLNELVVQTVETNGLCESNPLGITYGPPAQQKTTVFRTNNAIEILNRFIDSGVIGLKEWKPVFAEVKDQQLMERYLNLIKVMRISAENRLNILKTGRVVVRSGIEESVPSFNNLSSGKVRF